VKKSKWMHYGVNIKVFDSKRDLFAEDTFTSHKLCTSHRTLIEPSPNFLAQAKRKKTLLRPLLLKFLREKKIERHTPKKRFAFHRPSGRNRNRGQARTHIRSERNRPDSRWA
jgi:hypothetical protein